MKTIPLFLSVVAAGLGWAALPAQSQPPIPGPAYVRSTVGPPWGVSANESAMDRVFGSGQWRDLRFETLNVPQFLSESTFIFLEGSDQGAQVLEDFLTAHVTEIENWVSGGGVLFLNAAPNVGDGMSFGFGVALRYFDGTGAARAENAVHPIFNGPFVPVGTFWNGSFGLATVSGPGIAPLIVNDENGRFVLAEKAYGNGWVLFGGMTTDNFHSPQPEAQNLRANILAYANGQVVPPTNQPPQILTQPVSMAVLVGETVAFRAVARGSRPLSLQWFFNGQPLPDATNGSLVLNSVTTNQAGGYKLVASNPLGVAASERATLTVSLQGPHITVQPTSVSVRAGEDVTFSVLASGGPLFYQWRFNGVDLPGATNAILHLGGVNTTNAGTATNTVLHLGGVTTNNAGTYQVVVSNLLGYVTSLPATLTVNQFAPTITSQPFDQSVQSGDSVQFYVAADSAPLPTYQWRFNGLDLPGETNAFLFLPNVATNQAGAYSVVVGNSVGSVTSRAAALTVNEYPPTITSQPFDQTVTVGDGVNFFVGVSGSPPLTFQWRRNGTAIPGATNANLFLPSVPPGSAGSYTVAVSNHLGGVISLPGVLTVIGGASPVITSQPVNLTLLAGGSGNLIVVATGQPAPAYQWRRNGVDVPGASSSVLAFADIATNQSGNYTVVATNLIGVVTSRVAVVTVNLQAPMINTQPVSRTVDAGATVTFSVVASGGPPPSYQWLFNGEALPGAGDSSLVLGNVLPNLAGIYSVIVSNVAGAVTSAPAVLTINAAAPAITTQPGSRTVLEGSNATFVVSATGVPQVSFQWRFNGVDLPGRNTSVLSLTSVSTNAAGAYTVVVSNLLGVVVSEPAVLTVTQQAPVITAQTTNRTVFVGANVIFQVLVVAGPRPTYQWQREGANIPGANNSSLILSNVSRADDAIYAVVVSNPLGSVTSQPMRLTVRYQPPVITGNPTNRSVLAGNTAAFTVTVTGSVPLFYQWRFNGADLPGATDQTLVLAAVMTNQVGGYSCLVTNFGGATTSSVATLTVTVQPPVITSQPANRTVLGGTNVTFAVVASGAPPPTYQWRLNGVDVAGATNSLLTLINVGTNNAGGYSAVVSNPFGVLTSRVATLTVTVQPTVITAQPSDRITRPGGSATFSVSATGTPPMLFQWDYNGGPIPDATNATYTLTGATLDSEGSYRVTVIGAGGTVVSRKANLTIREPASGDFRITALLASNSRLVEHNFVTGDDRGGIAASSTRVFYTGDNQTGGFALADLSGGNGVGRQYDALVSDLSSETVYSLGNGATPLGGGGTVTTLIELDGATGQPTANVVTLSEPITMLGGSGLFAGYEQIALFNGARVYTVEPASGLVIDHGPFSMPQHSQCENWAFWGVAEQIAGELHLAFVRDSQTIARVRVTDGFVEPVATFSSLSDMCSFTLSLPRNRWYFHHEGQSQFGGSDESIGYADATWEVSLPGPPLIRQQPQNLIALAGGTAQFSVAATGARPLAYQWRFNESDLPGATNQTLLLPGVVTTEAGNYAVVVTNALGAITSQVATLTVELVAPSILAQPVSRTTVVGAQVSFSVIATGAPPPFYQWQFNGFDMSGATNATFVISNAAFSQAGNYAVVVANSSGSVTSAPALLSVIDAPPANAEFRITSLTADNSLVAEHDFLTGDDRGGIAVSDSQVFYTGDSSTARFALGDLSGGTSLGRQYDAMVSNLRTETVYSLGNGTTPVSNGGMVTTLIEIDGETGELTANTITLSVPIDVSPETGIFVGYDQVVLVTEGRAYSIHLPSGIVTDFGGMQMPNHQSCESWAFWGVAENFDGAVHVVYVRDSQTIVRTRVPDGATEVLATFNSLSDMCSFTVSLSLNRWYFHHEGGSQFGGSSETIGFADATWEFPVPPLPPTITQPPQNVNGLWGGSAMFQVAASGSLLSYQWHFNGAVLPGASTATLLLTNLAPDDAGNYAVIVRNPFGAVTSAPVALTVSALAPTVTAPPASQAVVLGVDVLFAAEINAAPQATLQWFFNNAALPGATNATLWLTNVTLSAAGGYRIVADNFAGSAISPVATLTVIPQVPLPVALDAPAQEWTTGGDAFWAGQPFTTHDGVDAAQSGFLFDDEQSWLQTTATGPGQVNFWWKVSSEAGYDFAQFTIGGVAQAAISGEVDWQQRTISIPAGQQILRWAYVKDGSFHEGADRAWLDEVRIEIAPRIVTQPASRTVAEGGTATLTVAAEGSAPLSYQWRKNGAPISQATNASLTLVNVQPNDTGGVYSVVVRNAYGSVTSSNATLTVVTIAPLVVGISNGGNLEERNALATTLTNLGFVVRFVSQGQWAGLDVVVSYPGDGIGPGVSEISTGVNYIQISDHGSDWTPNSWNSVTEGATITIRVDTAHPITSGLATSWTSHGFWRYGYLSEDFVGWSDDLALPSLASESQVVNHSRVLVANSVGDGRAVYIGWNVYGPDAGINDRNLFRNAISWAAGAAVVPTAPLIVQQPGSQTVAAGGTATFSVAAGGSTPLFYQWQLNGISIPGATNQTYALDYVLPDNAGDYTVVVSNQLGTVTSTPATLTVTVQAPVITAQPASQAVLGGGGVAFSVTASGVPAPTYQWRLDGADIPGATNSTLTLNNVSAADVGNYKVIVRNLAGTATSLPARLTVNILPPQITIQPISQSVLRGTNATFTVAATGAPAPTYQWRFNDADLAGETNPSLAIHQPTTASAGRYSVRVSNSGGAVISLTAELTVVESIALAEALDMPGPLWRSGGAVPWFGQPMTSHDGSDAASSGGIGDSRESWIETTVTGPGTVSFWWKVSSEFGFDRLNFSVGNQSLATVSGETDWQPRSFPLPEGPQTLRWSYAKDGSARDGADAGWLDQVVITTSPALVVHAIIVGADVRISFPTSPGRHYRIDRADDFTHSIQWFPVAGAENLLGTGLTMEVLDAGGAGFAQRFYRVTLLP